MGAPGWKMLGVECPECGDLRTGVTKAGFDEEGHRIRQRACRNCEERFTTLEFPIPFVFNQVDVSKPEREASRLRRDGPATKFTAAPRTIHAYFSITHLKADTRAGRLPRYGATITLHPASKSNLCRRGLHRLQGYNAMPRTDGAKTCRACSNIRASVRRREFRQRFPLIAKEQDAVKRDRQRARRDAARLAATA